MTERTAPSPTGPIPNDLLRGYRNWRQGGFSENRGRYERLAAEGQTPHTMLVACCDSRVDIPGVFGTQPGEFFVLRNIANLIPPHPAGRGDGGERHYGAAAAVDYAVNALRVARIAVVGHSGCGGVEACRRMCAGCAPELEAPDSAVGRWVDIFRDPCRKVMAEGRQGPDLSRRLEWEAVLTSLRNLRTFPFVRAAVAEGRLTLHGGWIDVATGTLHGADEDGRFAPVRNSI